MSESDNRKLKKKKKKKMYNLHSVLGLQTFRTRPVISMYIRTLHLSGF